MVSAKLQQRTNRASTDEDIIAIRGERRFANPAMALRHASGNGIGILAQQYTGAADASVT